MPSPVLSVIGHASVTRAPLVSQHRQVLLARQYLRLEPTHGARRGRAPRHRPAADQLAHHRVARQTIRIVHVLISGKTREDRLAKEARKSVSAVAPGPGIGNQAGGHLDQAEGVVQFPMQQQAAV